MYTFNQFIFIKMLFQNTNSKFRFRSVNTVEEYLQIF